MALNSLSNNLESKLAKLQNRAIRFIFHLRKRDWAGFLLKNSKDQRPFYLYQTETRKGLRPSLRPRNCKWSSSSFVQFATIFSSSRLVEVYHKNRIEYVFVSKVSFSPTKFVETKGTKYLSIKNYLDYTLDSQHLYFERFGQFIKKKKNVLLFFIHTYKYSPKPKNVAVSVCLYA